MKGLFEKSSNFGKLCIFALIFFTCALLAVILSGLYMLITQSTEINGNLKMMLFIQNTCIFILSPFIAQYFLWKTPVLQTLKLKIPRISILILGCVTILISSPLVDTLANWNEGLQLPESMQAIQQWMLAKEAEAGEITRQMLNTDNWTGILSNIFVIAILAGVGEELFFRGVLQKIFIDWSKNIHVGILVTAFIFSAVHLQFFGFAPRFVLGIILGYMYVWSGNLWVPISAHTVNNASVIIYSAILYSEGQEDTAPFNSIWLAIGSALLVGGCLYIIRKFGERESKIK